MEDSSVVFRVKKVHLKVRLGHFTLFTFFINSLVTTMTFLDSAPPPLPDPSTTTSFVILS